MTTVEAATTDINLGLRRTIQTAPPRRHSEIFGMESVEMLERRGKSVAVLEPMGSLNLVRELNHRVINDYTVVVAELALAAAEVASGDGRAALNQAQDRLRQLAAAHRALQAPTFAFATDLGSYLADVVAKTAKARAFDRRLSVELCNEDIPIEPPRAWRVGLVVVELLTNAAKHGSAQAPISVQLDTDGDELVAAVTSGGQFRESGPLSTGLEIVHALAAELEGRLVISRGNDGTTVRLSAPIGTVLEGHSYARDEDAGLRRQVGSR